MQKILLYCWLLLAITCALVSEEQDKYLLLRDADSKNFGALFEYMDANAPSEDAFVALMRIVAPHIKGKDWGTVVTLLNSYSTKFPDKKNEIEKIITILQAPEEKLIEDNLGDIINTASSEFSPILRADMSQIYYTSNPLSRADNQEDIYVANYSETEGWYHASKLRGSVRTRRSEAAQSLSVDGRIMYVYGNYSDSYGRGDLYEFYWQDSLWGGRKHLEAPINTRYYEGDANISTNGDALFFVSERPGSVGETNFVPGNKDTVKNYFHGSFFGNTDIYVALKTDSGWSKPINLGSMINTPFAERKPQLHADGKTLYFSSEGHAGLGRLDVYVSRRLSEDSWTEWSEPINLGKEINGSGRDWGIYVIPKGDDAYFSSSDKIHNHGLSDIYKIKLPQFARPYPVVAIDGKVIDQDGNPLQAEIVWEDLSVDKEISKIKSNSSDGKFFFILPAGKKYGYHARKDGYYPISKNLDLSKTNKYNNISDTLTMINIENLVNGTSLINNIFFEYDKAVLMPESFPELNRLVKMLEGLPGVKVEIIGHTDNIGTDEYNLTLSEERAKSVIEYLRNHGLKEMEFIAKGYGKKMPIVNNETDEGRAQNRRVEFRIIKIK